MSFRTDMILNVPLPRGEGVEIWIFNSLPETPRIINHGLSRIPVSCQIIDKDKFCDFSRQSWDRQKAVLTFFEAQVNLVLRFE